MDATFLFTAFALVLTLGCVACVYLCYRALIDCKETALELYSFKGRVAGSEHELAVLSSQIHRLRQKFYSPAFKESQTEIANDKPIVGSCENYVAAQSAGPASAAAQCECAFCTAKRVEREALRARFVPKTTAERRDAIEKGRRN